MGAVSPEEEYWDIRWIEYVRFYEGAWDLEHPYHIELVYVNLRAGFLWPTPARMQECGSMHLLACHLEYSASAPAALYVIRNELVSFGHYPLRGIASIMSSGIWRLMVEKCYDYLVQSAVGQVRQTPDENHEKHLLL